MVIYFRRDGHPARQDHTPPLLIDHEQIRKHGSDNAGIEIRRVELVHMVDQAIESNAANSNEHSQNYCRKDNASIEKGARTNPTLRKRRLTPAGETRGLSAIDDVVQFS